MASLSPQGPFCQSCAMPMEKPEHFGTHADGSLSQEYCCFCFRNGAFTEPNITMEQMMDKVACFMTENLRVPEAQAKEIVQAFIPKLKRWQGPHSP